MLSWEWRCSWSSADRLCSNYIWVINNFIAYLGAPYIRDFTVLLWGEMGIRMHCCFISLLQCSINGASFHNCLTTTTFTRGPQCWPSGIVVAAHWSRESRVYRRLTSLLLCCSCQVYASFFSCSMKASWYASAFRVTYCLKVGEMPSGLQRASEGIGNHNCICIKLWECNTHSCPNINIGLHNHVEVRAWESNHIPNKTYLCPKLC